MSKMFTTKVTTTYASHLCICPRGLSPCPSPWVNLEADWRPAAALPGSLCSDISPPARREASSGAYRPIQRDGYTATGGYSETSRDL